MKKLIALSLFVLPGLVFAQNGRVTDANSLIRKVDSLFNAIIPILISFAVVYLIYAIVKYVIATDEEGREKGKSMVGWGILGLFLILSIWGLVRVLVNTAGLGTQNQPNSQEIPTTVPIRPIQ